jgi:hypothetical protein
MSEFFSIISLLLLVVAQSAVATSGSTFAIATVLALHLVAIAMTVVYWFRKANQFLPPYRIVTVVSDNPKGGKVFSTERDSVLIGAGVAGLFYGGPVITRLIGSAEPTSHHAIQLLLVAVTPVSVYINWYCLRRFLWLLIPGLLGWSGWSWLAT